MHIGEEMSTQRKKMKAEVIWHSLKDNGYRCNHSDGNEILTIAYDKASDLWSLVYPDGSTKPCAGLYSARIDAQRHLESIGYRVLLSSMNFMLE